MALLLLRCSSCLVVEMRRPGSDVRRRMVWFAATVKAVLLNGSHILRVLCIDFAEDRYFVEADFVVLVPTSGLSSLEGADSSRIY